MRRRSIVSLVLVSAVVVACSTSGKGVDASAYGPVRISIACNNDGTLGSFYMTSWAVTLPDPHAAFRFFNDGGVDFEIAAQDRQYPFAGKPLHAPHKGSVDGKPVPGTPKGTYKYSITVVCTNSVGGKDTTVVDPDMIIPWHID